MDRNSLNFIYLPYLLILITLFTFSQSVVSSNFSPFSLADDVCKLIYCGAGTCEPSNASILGFECVCNPGWKTFQIFPMPFPSCLLPNCTVNLGCGNGAAAPPPPVFNSSNPCSFVWCGDGGTCLANGTTGHICQCNEGYVNLFNDTNWLCIQQCYLGADCSGLVVGSPPPPSAAAPPKNGFGFTKSSSCFTNFCHLILLLISAILSA